MTFAEFQKALHVLGLRERATLKEIKTRHRALAKRHHPDTGSLADPKMIREVNAAYRILHDYISAYRFCFDEDEFYRQNPEERLRLQFRDDPLWGN